MIDQKNGVFPAVCPLDCPDTCGLLLHKEDGKIVKVTKAIRSIRSRRERFATKSAI